MKKGICVLDNEKKCIKYLTPEGGGLGYNLIKVDENSLELWKQSKTVEFHIVEFHLKNNLKYNRAIIISSLEDKLEKFFSEFNPFKTPHAGVSKMGTGPGAAKIKEDIISPQSVPEPKEQFGQLFYTKEEGWIVRYKIEKTSIPVLPSQTKNLSAEQDNGKKVLFEIIEHYIAPLEDVNNSKGEFIKVARLTSDVKNFNKEIQLFHPETSSHEVFAIKENIAFIGYKLPNGDFYFECVLYTEKVNSNVKAYVEEQIKFKNIQEHQTTWMESICQYWYNKGKESK